MGDRHLADIRGLRGRYPALPTDAELAAKRPINAAAEPRDLPYNVARFLIERA